MEAKTATYDDLRLELWLRKREKGEIIWEDGNKVQRPIKSLSDEHLQNILNYLDRKAAAKAEMDDVFSFDLF